MGLDGFVKSLAAELGPHGIRVNAIAPGFTVRELAQLLLEGDRIPPPSQSRNFLTGVEARSLFV